MDAPNGSEVEYLIVGRVAAPHGVRGLVRVAILSDDPQRFLMLERVYVGDDLVPYEIYEARLRPDKGQVLLSLEGVQSREGADALRGQMVHVHMADALPLEEGQFFFHQIEGLLVVDQDGAELGRVKEILPTGANDVYVVDGPSRELLLPAIADVVLSIRGGIGCGE